VSDLHTKLVHKQSKGSCLNATTNTYISLVQPSSCLFSERQLQWKLHGQAARLAECVGTSYSHPTVGFQCSTL